MDGFYMLNHMYWGRDGTYHTDGEDIFDFFAEEWDQVNKLMLTMEVEPEFDEYEHLDTPDISGRRLAVAAKSYDARIYGRRGNRWQRKRRAYRPRDMPKPKPTGHITSLMHSGYWLEEWEQYRIALNPEVMRHLLDKYDYLTREQVIERCCTRSRVVGIRFVEPSFYSHPADAPSAYRKPKATNNNPRKAHS